MLGLFPQRESNCEAKDRRNFLLQLGSLSGVGLGLDQLLRHEAEAARPKSQRSCILIWTRGGTSHHDTLDPKPHARAEVRGEFGVIDTAIPGVPFSDKVPHFARHVDKMSVVRNLNSLNGAHGTADAIMMSGRLINPTINYPCYGSVVSRQYGSRDNMPAFVQIFKEVDRKFFGGTAGYLGIAHNPFEIDGDPNDSKFTVKDLTPPGGVSLRRVRLRQQALRTLDTFQRQTEQSAALSALDRYYQRAFEMITSQRTQQAFDLKRESSRTRDDYGRNAFGQGCLLARRLVEAGTRFVTVSNADWDTHRDNFSRLKELLPPVDQGITALISDLKVRGMLEDTLVVWLTDFGRTPKINPASGRDHWASAGIACFAGAGVPGGQIIGKTDAIGGRAVGEEYYPRDIAATIYSKLGIDLHTTHLNGDGRPMRLCEGRPIKEVM